MIDDQVSTAVLGMLRANMSPDAELGSEPGAMLLVDLGIDSMRLITMIMALEEEIGLDLDRVAGATPPRTVDDLVHLATQSCPAREGTS